LLAFERTKLIPRAPAKLDLAGMVQTAGADTAEKIVDHFVRRFLSVKPGERERALLVEFLKSKLGPASLRQTGTLESSLRELLYLVLSMPEYQVG
jgi:hypothetical protein